MHLKVAFLSAKRLREKMYDIKSIKWMEPENSKDSLKSKTLTDFKILHKISTRPSTKGRGTPQLWLRQNCGDGQRREKSQQVTSPTFFIDQHEDSARACWQCRLPVQLAQLIDVVFMKSDHITNVY